MACSELSTLSQRLAALAPALAAAVEAGAPMVQGQSPAMVQGIAAGFAASACIHIGTLLKVKGSDALRVAAAARLLLLVGRAVLRAVADDVRRHPTAQHSQSSLEIILTRQLYGMEGCMALVDSCERPDAIAVFAATTAAPGALLPWLAAAGDVLLLACRTRRHTVWFQKITKG